MLIILPTAELRRRSPSPAAAARFSVQMFIQKKINSGSVAGEIEGEMKEIPVSHSFARASICFESIADFNFPAIVVHNQVLSE
jgi:hypothetical protein